MDDPSPFSPLGVNDRCDLLAAQQIRMASAEVNQLEIFSVVSVKFVRFFFRFCVQLVVDEGTGLKFLDAGQSGNERAVLSLSLSGCLMAKGPATRGPGRWQNRPKLRRKTSRSSVISLVPSQGSDCQAGRCRHLRLQCGSGGVPVTAMPT